MNSSVFERYSFAAITTKDLALAWTFWVSQLRFKVTEKKTNDHFIVDAGGLRLCVDTADGDQHRVGSTDPVIGLKVKSLQNAASELSRVGIKYEIRSDHGNYLRLRDPDGRCIVITETD